eukprot:gene7473-10186_t
MNINRIGGGSLCSRAVFPSFSRIASLASTEILQQQRRGLKRPPVHTSQLSEGRRTGAIAMKVGMLAFFDKWGVRFPATVLQVDNCEVVQVKTVETNGYTALQLGAGEAKLSRVKVTELGHFKKAGVYPKRKLWEFRVTPDCLLDVGTKISALHFVPGQLIDACGTSKGKGFQGVMKRWNFKGGRATHGNSLSHRNGGATGGRQDPGRVFKNQKMAGRMGGERTTVQNLIILKIDPKRNLIFVKGAVPGTNGSFLRIVDAVKGPFYPSPPPFPTFLADPSQLDEMYAELSATDSGVFKAPDDPYN